MMGVYYESKGKVKDNFHSKNGRLERNMSIKELSKGDYMHKSEIFTIIGEKYDLYCR